MFLIVELHAMVVATHDESAPRSQIVLTPNRSLTWRLNLIVLAALSALSLSIATSFLLRGLWPIFPFTVLELSVVYLCFRHLVRRNQQQEVITITRDAVTVERGRQRPQESHQYQRLWTKFLVSGATASWAIPRVSVRSQGKELELGAFLNRDDKDELARELRFAVTVMERYTAQP